MGFSTEVKAVLGIDTSKMPEDSRKVIEAFKAASKQIEQDSAKSGVSAGGKFAEGLTGKLANAKMLGTTLATALGVNLDSISQKILEAVFQGSLEGWNRFADEADRGMVLLARRRTAGMSEKQVDADLQDKLGRAQQDLDAYVKKISAPRTITQRGMYGEREQITVPAGEYSAEQQTERERLTNNIREIEAQIAERAKQSSNELKGIAQRRLDEEENVENLLQKEAAIRTNMARIQAEIDSGKLNAVELARAQLAMDQKRNDLKKVYASMQEEELNKEKVKNQLAEKNVALTHQRRELEQDEAKLTDRSKMTIGELAMLKTGESDSERQRRRDEEDRARAFGGFGADANLSSEAAAARDKAIQVKRLEEDAEAARLRGDSAKSLELMGQVGVMRDSLVKSGFTKSTEGDPARALREQIAKDNEQIIKTLNDISTTEKGKYVNQ